MNYKGLGKSLVFKVTTDLLNTLAVLTGKSDTDTVNLRGLLNFDLLFNKSRTNQIMYSSRKSNVSIFFKEKQGDSRNESEAAIGHANHA